MLLPRQEHSPHAALDPVAPGDHASTHVLCGTEVRGVYAGSSHGHEPRNTGLPAPARSRARQGTVHPQCLQGQRGPARTPHRGPGTVRESALLFSAAKLVVLPQPQKSVSSEAPASWHSLPGPVPAAGSVCPPSDPSACLWTRRIRGLRHGHCLAGLSCTDRLQPGRCWSPGGGLTLGSLALAPPAPTSSLTGVCSTPHFLPPSSAAPVTMRRSGAPRIHPLPGLSGAGLPSPSLSFPRRAHWSSRPGLHASGQGVTSMRQEQLGSQGTARTQLQEGKPRRAQRSCALLRSQGWSSGRAWAVPQPVSPTGAPLGPADVGTGGDNA